MARIEGRRENLAKPNPKMADALAKKAAAERQQRLDEQKKAALSEKVREATKQSSAMEVARKPGREVRDSVRFEPPRCGPGRVVRPSVKFEPAVLGLKKHAAVKTLAGLADKREAIAAKKEGAAGLLRQVAAGVEGGVLALKKEGAAKKAGATGLLHQLAAGADGGLLALKKERVAQSAAEAVAKRELIAAKKPHSSGPLQQAVEQLAEAQPGEPQSP